MVKAANSTQCFTGVRASGVRPVDAAACNTCYACRDGPSIKSDGSALHLAHTAGMVTEAGSDVCSRMEGKEHLCLSCNAGAGLLRYGDSKLDLFALGYSQAGRCQPYPILDVRKTTPDEESPESCKGVCFPEQGHTFTHSKMLSCTKVCSSWNPIVVPKHGTAGVAATALCHLRKDSYCIANATAGHSAATLHTPGHTCTDKKQLAPAAACYSKAIVNGESYDDGYGAICDGDSVPMTDAAVKDWLHHHAAGNRWCCYTDLAALPAWLQSVPSHMWCAGSAMRE